MKEVLLVIIIGYFFGCLQSSYLIGKYIKKIDIRKHGTGNAGASNTTIVLGWKYGAMVALIDILKAIISILIVKWIFNNYNYSNNLYFLLYLNGLFVILGHNYPFYMSFKGGKGTASLIGMMLVINYKMGLIGILAIVIITIVSDYIAIGTFGTLISLIVLTKVFGYGNSSFIIAIIISLLSLYKHIPNIIRIINKEETGLRKTL